MEESIKDQGSERGVRMASDLADNKPPSAKAAAVPNTRGLEKTELLRSLVGWA